MNSHPYSGTPSTPYPRPSQIGSLNTLREVPPATTSPTGWAGQVTPYPVRPSSDTERASQILNEAWLRISELDNSKGRSMALTKIEEALLWVGSINE